MGWDAVGAATLKNGYDAFISHNRADKEWVRSLTGRLASVDYNGRPLRPWLDEHFLDPGELSGTPELTSALDRSRTFVIVLSPASVASGWVKFELDYFLARRPRDEIIPLVRAPCDIPEPLQELDPLYFADAVDFDASFAALTRRLCPVGDLGVIDAERTIHVAWDRARADDPGGLSPDPTPARDALVTALLQFDIGDPVTEGLALVAFSRAAQLLLSGNTENHPATYNLRMLLGECLALAVTRNARYRQVAQRYLDLEDPATPDPILGAVVVRAYSKLAELDPALVDMGTLLRVAAQLDASPLNDKKSSLAMLLGRVAAKQRGTERGDLLIKALSTGGAAARIAAIGGITMGEQRASSVFYSGALAALHTTGTPLPSGALEPPSRKLQAMLSGIDLDQPDLVRRHLDNARYDLRRDFGIDDLPYGYSWFALRKEPVPDHLHHGPILGTVARATIANMEELALRVDASHVVCLTEPRVVDALFDRAGAIVIASQADDSPLHHRLTSRAVPYAAVGEGRMAELGDGDHVAVEARRVMRVVSRR